MVSIDQFKTITDADQRRKIIDQAPPEQRDELNKIDFHMRMVASVGGEAGFKAVKESSIAKARGFTDLEDVFTTQTQIWDDYMAGVDDANRKSGMTHKQTQEAWTKMQVERNVINNRLSAVHSLVASLAPSLQAFELEKKAERVNQDMRNRFGPEGSSPKKRVTKEERQDFDKRMDEIYTELKAMPRLPPEQAQKEYDAFPDEKVRPW